MVYVDLELREFVFCMMCCRVLEFALLFVPPEIVPGGGWGGVAATPADRGLTRLVPHRGIVIIN